MELQVFYCEQMGDDGKYFLSDDTMKVQLKNRVFTFTNGATIEVSFKAYGETTGHYPHINGFFKDKNKDQHDDERKYFAQLSQWEIFKIRWMYNQYWIQSTGNVMLVILAILGLIATIYAAKLSK